MGGDGGDAKGPGGVPPPGGQAYHEDDDNTWDKRGVGISPGGGGTGIRGTTTHKRVQYEAAGNHSGK